MNYSWSTKSFWQGSSQWEQRDLITALGSHPPPQSQLVTLSHSQTLPAQLQISHDPLHRQLLQHLQSRVVSLDAPQLHTLVDPCSGEHVGLLDVVHSTNPSLRVGLGKFEDRFHLLGVPEVD